MAIAAIAVQRSLSQAMLWLARCALSCSTQFTRPPSVMNM
jgi:hypothetical protein